MITVTPADIRTLDSDYSTVDDALIQFYIDLALDYVNEARWGTAKATRGVQLMTLHMLERAGVGANATGSSTGAVLSESVGNVSVTYAQPVGSADGSTLALTSWGEQFEMLKRTVIRTPLVT